MTFTDAADRHYPAFSTDACIKCNVCNTVCPVARVTDLFPGPKYVGPQAQRFREAPRSADHSVDLCSGCGFCTRACPQGVRIAETNSRARAEMVEERGSSLRNRVIADTDLLIRLGVPFAPLANFALRSRILRWIGERVVGVHRSAALHPFARRTFQAAVARRRVSDDRGPDRTLIYFHGCAVNGFETSLGRDAISVLERNGFSVIVPPQSCCALPMISNGLYPQARAKARRNLTVLGDYARRGYRIVTTSTSCGYTLKAEYAEMLDLDDPDARAVARQTWDICELLGDLHERSKLDTRLAPLDRELPYHPPCQLKAHGIGTPAMDLFALIPGLRAWNSEHDCCGAAGTYGLKRERWQIAQDVGRGLFARLRERPAPDMACDSETCRWQITASTSIPARHPVEYIAESYRRWDAAHIGDVARAEAGTQLGAT